MIGALALLLQICLFCTSFAFSPQISFRPKTSIQSIRHKNFLGDSADFDPFPGLSSSETPSHSSAWIVPTTTAFTILGFAENARADGLVQLSGLTPSTFQPVCPASDGFYRFLQSTTVSAVGRENFVEYGPLIAGGLLRVRLELCVVESFFNEAVGPFIEQNGVSWILPLHETVETFLAGTIFALASTFI